MTVTGRLCSMVRTEVSEPLEVAAPSSFPHAAVSMARAARATRYFLNSTTYPDSSERCRLAPSAACRTVSVRLGYCVIKPMTKPRIATFDAHPATVFEALLDTAEALGSKIRIIDAKARQVVFSGEGRLYQVSASINDNGRGQTTVHMSCTPPRSLTASKCAKRLIASTKRSLKDLAAYPPPTPPPPATGQ